MMCSGADLIGCVHEKEFTITQPNPINPNAVLITPSCYGMSDGSITINLSGGSGVLSYYWLNGTGTADSLYGLSSGISTLVVSDSLICVDSFNFSLSEPDSLIIAFSNFEDFLDCNGAITALNLSISGGTGPFSILWNDGVTTAQRIVGAGNYSCIVTDALGCPASDSLVITEPDLLTIDLTYSAISCDEGGAASVSISGGVEPITVLWNNGDTIQMIDSLWGTTYWVIVTDSCGNSASDTFELSPYILETSVFYDDSIHVGEVEVDTCSSVGPFTYQWVDVLGNIISTDSITSNLCEGTYFVTTTDSSSNCSVTDTLIATYYLPNGIVDISTTTVFSDADLWGNSPYSYFWDNGEVVAHANICPGSHWVEVSDNNGCIVRADFDIDPLLISLDPADLIIECNLENLDVEITADATGGTEPYTYAWSNGSAENSINLSLSPGNYSVTVIDNNICIEDTSFRIATMTAECIPNVFTPNGDNINDTWSLEDTFLYSDSEVRIYGRYGKLLFQSVGYTSSWDGKNEKGNDVPAGAYFYSIEIGHNFDAINGSVTILR
jgi:gliding motility-associated-like protein